MARLKRSKSPLKQAGFTAEEIKRIQAKTYRRKAPRLPTEKERLLDIYLHRKARQGEQSKMDSKKGKGK